MSSLVLSSSWDAVNREINRENIDEFDSSSAVALPVDVKLPEGEFDFSDVFGPVHRDNEAEFIPEDWDETENDRNSEAELFSAGEEDMDARAPSGSSVPIPMLQKSKSSSIPKKLFSSDHLCDGLSKISSVPKTHNLESWAPIDSITAGGKPLVIHHRSHSLVGPAYVLSRSLNLAEVSEKQGGQSFGQRRRSFSREKTSLHVSCQEDSSGSSSGDEDNSDDQNAALDQAEGNKIGPQDFELLQVVGQGAFGKVFQVKKKDTGEILAMKVMKKDRIKDRNQGDYMKAERDILTKAIHPFIVQLQYSFQTNTKLYLLLDFINGGHLFFQLYRKGIFKEELARIYCAEIILAVAHLHKMGIMHRDLKPENILLDHDGHVKLTDFGLAKEVHDNAKSNSLCGTMEYMAPEIIDGSGHGKSADWWSVGVLLFEMLTGQPPFMNNNRQKLQKKITKEKAKYPSYLTSPVVNLLKQLLEKDPAKRLGSGANGSEDIKKHPWFKTINWKKLESRDIQPSFKPTVNGKHCTANFDEKWTTMPVQDSPVGTPTSEDLLNLGGYSFAAPRQHLPTVDSDSDEQDDADDAAG